MAVVRDEVEAGSTAASVVFVSSAGGVLLDVLAVRAAWPGSSVRWVATRAEDTVERLAAEDVTWVDEPSARQPLALVGELRRARRALTEHRPDWVVSAGTAVAVPWFVAARSLRIPTLWIETLNLHGDQGRAAAVCSRLSERVLVQRPDRLACHRRAVLLGELY